MKSIPELLAPAGSHEALKAAINSGADAIYLSGKQFGARQYAANFGINQLKEAVNYGHLRGVKIYVTVNTLIKESELPSLTKYLLQLYEIGVDAILVQDVGVAALARALVPELDIHASTQMTIHHQDGLKWAEEMGFKRVVLSRELSVDEVLKMSRESDLELEIFLHGALCYCYSGQCLLSSFIGGRSGNRGMCAQPCRKPYDLLIGEKDNYGKPQNLKKITLKDKYLISPKDLSLYKNLDIVIDSGIKSLKIEGRMRSPEYVATVVKIYRDALDQIAQGNWKHSTNDRETLQMTFNRGFTEGHFFKEKGHQLMGRDKPGHRGLYLGKLIKYNHKNKTAEIEINTIHKPQIGDGLYLKSPSEYSGQGLDLEKAPIFKKKSKNNRQMNKMIIPLIKPVPPSTEVYLTKRKKFSDNTKAVIKGQPKKVINIDLSFKIDETNHPILEGKWELPGRFKNEIKFATVRGEKSMEFARNRPLNSEQIQTQLLKIGDKPFKTKFIDFKYPGGLFLPIKDLNQLRRNLMEKVESISLESYRPSLESIEKSKNSLNELRVLSKINDSNKLKNNHYSLKRKNIDQLTPDQVNLAIYADNLDNLKTGLESGVNRVYFEPVILTNSEILGKCYGLSSKNRAEVNKSKNFTSKSKYHEKIANLLIEAQMLCNKQEAHFVWKWPSITRQSLLKNLKEIYELIYEKLGFFPDIMVGSHGIAQNLKNFNPSVSIYGSSSLNIWNHQTIDQLSDNYQLLTLSPELSKKDLKNLLQKQFSEIELEILVQGNLKAVISADCLISPDLIPENQFHLLKENSFWGLQDSKKRIFPLKISPECETILLNSVEICLINYLDEILSMGIFNLAIDARGRTPDYIKDMVQYYLQGIEQIIKSQSDNSNSGKKINLIKNKVKKISLGGLTSSNFLKGVEKVNK